MTPNSNRAASCLWGLAAGRTKQLSLKAGGIWRIYRVEQSHDGLPVTLRPSRGAIPWAGFEAYLFFHRRDEMAKKRSRSG